MSITVELSPLRGYLDGPIAVRVDTGTKVADVLERLGIALPEGFQIGIWGRKTGREAPLREGDRIEFYRPLPHDPKAARRARAACGDP